MRTVGEVAALTGCTVRALHHYEELGLVTPMRSDAGYRLYSDDDIRRLHDVVALRALDIPLNEIARLLDDPASDRVDVLKRHRLELLARADRIHDLVDALDRAIARTDTPMSTDDIRELFHGFDPAAHEHEVSERWGGEPAYAEASRRTRGYSRDDWQRLRDEGEEIMGRFVALHADGVPAHDPRACAAARDHREHIDRWFYPCPPQMHRELAVMYLDDPRFREHFDLRAEGLAVYVHDAVHAAD